MKKGSFREWMRDLANERGVRYRRGMPQVNFDHQSGTALLPEAQRAMEPFLRGNPCSPTGYHRNALIARSGVEQAREQVASFLNAESPESIIFTSSGTEALNLAVKGTAWSSGRHGNHIVYSAIEHPAIIESIRFLEGRGFSSSKVPVDSDGFVSAAAVQEAITDDTVLICVHHANHDVGVIEPIAEIGAAASERGIPLCVDAVASAGWAEVDVQKLGAALLAVSPSRFYGPRGVGILYRHRRARLTSLVHGGLQESGRRAGHENVPAIVAAGVAAEIAKRDLAPRVERVRALQERLWSGLRSLAGVRLNGPEPGANRLPNNLNFSFRGVEGEGLAIALDMKGFAVASGSSCLGHKLKAPPTLQALGVPIEHALGNLIVTLGFENSAAEVDAFLAVIPKTLEMLRSMDSGGPEPGQDLFS